MAMAVALGGGDRRDPAEHRSQKSRAPDDHDYFCGVVLDVFDFAFSFVGAGATGSRSLSAIIPRASYSARCASTVGLETGFND